MVAQNQSLPRKIIGGIGNLLKGIVLVIGALLALLVEKLTCEHRWEYYKASSFFWAKGAFACLLIVITTFSFSSSRAELSYTILTSYNFTLNNEWCPEGQLKSAYVVPSLSESQDFCTNVTWGLTVFEQNPPECPATFDESACPLELVTICLQAPDDEELFLEGQELFTTASSCGVIVDPPTPVVETGNGTVNGTSGGNSTNGTSTDDVEDEYDPLSLAPVIFDHVMLIADDPAAVADWSRGLLIATGVGFVCLTALLIRCSLVVPAEKNVEAADIFDDVL